MCGVPTYYLNI